MIKILAISLFVVNIFLFLLFSILQHFPFYALFIHTISIVVLLGWILRFQSLLPFLRKHVLDIVLVFGIFFIAFTVYSYKVDVVTPGMHLDEITIAMAGERVLSSEYTPFVDVNYGHPTPLLYLTGLSIEWFGRTLYAIRLSSILFGALTVAVFYILLRLFFNKTVSLATSLLMLFSYPLVVVSRLAYEITPALFFQILTLTFLYLAWKTKNIRYYAAVGLSLGGGLYTYIGFRTFAFLITGIIAYIAFKTWGQNPRSVKQSIAAFLLTLFIVTAPLLSYSLGHAEIIAARAKSLSPFNQGLPVMEIMKEVQGSTFRLTNLFLATGTMTDHPDGDPDPRRNPSKTTLFDIGTFLLFIVGATYLFKKNKQLLAILLVVSISPIVNDIFSLERIPDGHYYGLGHPNTLRIAGVIPIIYFVIAYGLTAIKPVFDQFGKGIYMTGIIFIASIIIGINYNIYYNQIVDKNNYSYVANGAKMIQLADNLNKSNIQDVLLSPSIIKDGRFQYFVRKDLSIEPFTPNTIEDIMSASESQKLIIVDPDQNTDLIKALSLKMQEQPELFSNINLISGPGERWNFLIFGKTNF